MMRVALDASVLLKMFTPHSERNVDHALEVLAAWEAGRVAFTAPDLLLLESLNVAARKWQLPEPALSVLADAIDAFDIDMRPPATSRVIHWASRGLTAYDASYVAVAEAERVPLITDDAHIVRIAGDDVATALDDVPELLAVG